MLSKTNQKILIVDDKESWRRNYEKILRNEGHYILSADNYDDALKLIDKHFFHAAVIDLRLIDRDENNEQGMSILEKLYQTGEMTGLVVISGFPTSDRVKRAYARYDVVDFIEKDEFEPETLIADIRKATSQSAKYIHGEESRLKQFAQNEIGSQIGHTPSPDIVSLFESLAKPLLPLANLNKKHEISESKLIYSKDYWSRFLGKRVHIDIGHRAHILETSRQLKEAGKDVFVATQQGLSGLRCVIDNDLSTELPKS